MQAQVARLEKFKSERSATAVRSALDALASASHDPKSNLFESVVSAAEADVTHGEICACLRDQLGFGEPLIRP